MDLRFGSFFILFMFGYVCWSFYPLYEGVISWLHMFIFIVGIIIIINCVIYVVCNFSCLIWNTSIVSHFCFVLIFIGLGDVSLVLDSSFSTYDVFPVLSVLYGCVILFVILSLGMVGICRVLFEVIFLSFISIVILLSFDFCLCTIFEMFVT